MRRRGDEEDRDAAALREIHHGTHIALGVRVAEASQEIIAADAEQEQARRMLVERAGSGSSCAGQLSASAEPVPKMRLSPSTIASRAGAQASAARRRRRSRKRKRGQIRRVADTVRKRRRKGGACYTSRASRRRYPDED